MSISSYFKICDALAILFHPLVEAVIHNRQTKKIEYISGQLSARTKSQDSMIDDDLEAELDKVTYPKLNFDGKLIKSISIELEQPWLLCINCDVSIFRQLQSFSNDFLTHSAQPVSLFRKDYLEKINFAINCFVEQKKWSFNQLTQHQKKQLVRRLFELDAFDEKNAADFIANILKISRATIFNYLRQFKSAKN